MEQIGLILESNCCSRPYTLNKVWWKLNFAPGYASSEERAHLWHIFNSSSWRITTPEENKLREELSSAKAEIDSLKEQLKKQEIKNKSYKKTLFPYLAHLRVLAYIGKHKTKTKQKPKGKRG